jgi:fused signal recognition particle receptor
MAFFRSFTEGLNRTRQNMLGKIANVLGVTQIDEDTWDDLEAVLIQADVGVDSAGEIIQRLQNYTEENGITRTSDLQKQLFIELRSLLKAPPPLTFPGNPCVLMMVGVNGSGKTTTSAKLAQHFRQQYGLSPILAACDTFRAAAVEQLQVWGGRLGVEVISSVHGADPGAVLHDAISAARSRGNNLVIADTAGRLHTKYNLMEELKKVHRVAGRAEAGAPHHVWLVLDAVTGQNAMHQARAFKEAAHVTGVVITKLDSSARGGMVFAIRQELGLPVYYLGLGEKVEDLRPFNPDAFVEALVKSREPNE